MRKPLLSLLFSIICAFPALAQIPNAQFEKWTDHGKYKTPDGWDNLDSVIDNSGSSEFTCRQGTPGFEGNSYLLLESRATGSFGIVIPGVAVCGKVDPINLKVISGFPYSGRPKSLTGRWQFMAGDFVDQPFVKAGLTKWNSSTNKRDTIATLYKTMPVMMMAWDSFIINFNYNDGTSIADSAIIIFSASRSKPVDKSYLYIDNIAFSNTASGVEDIHNNINDVVVFPNPAIDDVNISFSTSDASPYKVQIMDIHGRLIQEKTTEPSIGNHHCPFQTGDMPKGIYLVKINGGKTVETYKLILE